MTQDYQLETILAHAGINSDEATGALASPIHFSTTYQHPEFGQSTGFDYTRTKNPTRALGDALSESSKTVLSAGFVLIFTIPMVRIFINSGVNLSDVASMPVASAELFAGTFGSAFPLISSTIGALGAFIAGSNTVSNMMFSQFQYEAAMSLHISPSLIIAAQAVGAAAGNMIAIHNVVAASATVGLLGREGLQRRTHESLSNVRLGRSQNAGPRASTKSPLATRKPSSLTVMGNCGSARAAGPKIGLPYSRALN